ncbi:MAG: zinc ribbon domain-containing protein [Anaerolineales bacterium]|nr:zinc ribbon domain-containing protein [Anaerolineales bacterium]
MPIYTYRCESCGIQFDRQQKFSDNPLTVCPECNKKSLHKVYQPVGIVFKGKGFYATDHKSPSGQKFAPSGDKKETATTSTSEARNESSSSKDTSTKD